MSDKAERLLPVQYTYSSYILSGNNAQDIFNTIDFRHTKNVHPRETEGEALCIWHIYYTFYLKVLHTLES
jgi:hypothetical protein